MKVQTHSVCITPMLIQEHFINRHMVWTTGIDRLVNKGGVDLGYKCLVCNFDSLYDKPYDDEIASDEICPCCGFQYGYDDSGKDDCIYEQWRKKWIEDGCKWFSKGRKAPKNWNPKEQVKPLL